MHRSLLLAIACAGLTWLPTCAAEGTAKGKTSESAPTAQDAKRLVPVGAAKVNITPDYPVRLTGYGSRRVEATEVAQPLWAKALAIGGDEGDGPALLITVENCGITPAIRDAVAKRLNDLAQVHNERLAISTSHSHTAPCLTNWAPYLFGTDMPADQQERIDRYTRELTDKIVEVSLAALEQRRPGRLARGSGKVEFAVNRRVLNEGLWQGFGEQLDGPVDHSLPVLAARDPDGELLAVVVNYACHCTTLGGDFNQIAGDWAGFAQEFIEQDHPGAIALITIGTGADANPTPRGDLDVARQHGRAMADEVARLLKGELTGVSAELACRLTHVQLPFDKLPTREEFTQRTGEAGAVGYHAKRYLERLERGESLPTTLNYPVATWTFGDDLAMVFLGGEVVVDYGIRLKDEFDADRLWITAYTNDVPCYIPSKRILREGGYEADRSMIYYARPTRLAPETEDIIVDTVQKLLPARFYSAEKQQDFPPPLSPAESLATIQVPAGLKIELVAAEPLIADPVAFDWGPDGRLWVVEMYDYPNGIGWQEGTAVVGEPGGRVKVLEDTNGDGRYDRATLFLDKLPFPTGIKVWRKGVLITAAPEILYAEDTNGDGVADRREVLYAGFGEGNQQHRVNGLRWGLDNWLYVGNGDSGGRIRSLKTGEEIEIRGRDLRIRPDEGLLDAQSGQTQFGRCKDDWGNWFGGNNSNPMWHYVLADEYLRRNRHFVPPDVRKHVSVQPGAAPVFPISRTLARFNDFDRANRFTSACSPIIYRDELLGRQFAGNSFVCEPVHNLVHREIVEADGATFTSRRAETEQESEFLASSDNWFRPSMVRTGPEGGLWIADMYRFVIEHPTWIPAEWQRKLDLRAGDTRGRIYRVIPAEVPPREFPRLDRLDTLGLVAALDSPNGWQRDMAQQLLLWRADRSVLEPLEAMARSAERPQARLHAICTLDGLGALNDDLLAKSLRDAHPGVRRHAVRLAEPRLNERPELSRAVAGLADDPDIPVRMQVAYSLGVWRNAQAAPALAKLAVASLGDPYLKAAVTTSITVDNIAPLVAHVLRSAPPEARQELLAPLLAQATILRAGDVVNSALGELLAEAGPEFDPPQATAVLTVLDAATSQAVDVVELFSPEVRERLAGLVEQARTTAANEQADESSRVLAVRLLAADPADRPGAVDRIGELLSPRNPPAVQLAAVAALQRLRDERTPELFLADWSSHTPAVRAEMFDVLINRKSWTEHMLKAFEQGQVPISHLDARRRQQLLDHRDQEIRGRAEKVLATATSGDRQAVVTEYATALMEDADVERGKAVFAKRCAACHRMDGVGHATGPDLAALNDKSPQSLLIAILDPNRAVEDRYLDYVAATVDGRVVSGMLAGETGSSITLVAQEGKRFEIPRSELEQLRSTGKSLMPEGMERDVSPQDLSDLIAYLRGSSQPTK